MFTMIQVIPQNAGHLLWWLTCLDRLASWILITSQTILVLWNKWIVDNEYGGSSNQKQSLEVMLQTSILLAKHKQKVTNEKKNTSMENLFKHL